MVAKLSTRLSQVASDLGLPDLGDHQDWGIQFADPQRLPEFVAYYRHHQAGFDDWTQEYSLGELLLESANDALRDGGQPRPLMEEAVALIAARRKHKPTRVLLDYWTQLDAPKWEDGASQFPIAAVLRKALER